MSDDGNPFKDQAPAEWSDQWLSCAYRVAQGRFRELGSEQTPKGRYRRLAVAGVLHDLAGELDSRNELARRVDRVFAGRSLTGGNDGIGA